MSPIMMELLSFAGYYPLIRQQKRGRCEAVDKPKVGGERASERLAEATGPEQAAPKSQRHA